MKKSTYGLVIYYGLVMFYKLYADPHSYVHTNLYWLFSSLFNMIVAYELSKHFFIRMYKLIWRSSSVYWATMFLFHFICVFNIELYKKYAISTNKITVGSTFLMMILIFLTLNIFKNDIKIKR
jgi:hypothetical protein